MTNTNNSLTVKVATKLNPNTWDKIGEKYIVRDYPYMATYGCTINKCFCDECISYRGNDELHKMYEVIEPEEKKGNLLFQQCCDILDS